MNPVGYAVVSDERSMSCFFGYATSILGVCLVNSGTATFHIAKDRTELAEIIGDLPTVPSGFGNAAACISLAEELEALAIISDEAARIVANDGFEASMPPGFSSGLPRRVGGLTVRLTPFGLDFAITTALALELGWKEGDRIGLGVNSAGTLLCLTHTPQGALIEQDLDSLSPEHAVPGLPLTMDMADSGEIEPEYQISGKSIIFACNFRKSSVNPTQNIHLHVPDGPTLSPAKGERFPVLIGLVSGIVIGLALAWLLASL